MTVSSIILTLAVALIAVGGTLGGTLLGKSATKEQWHREHFLDACAASLAACDAIFFEVNKAYHQRQRSPEQFVEQLEVVLDKVEALSITFNRVLLLGPDDIKVPLTDLSSYITGVMVNKSVEAQRPSPEEWDNIILTGYKHRYYAFLDAARRDLGTQPATRRNFLRIFPARRNSSKIR